jgi:hypothetical protein
MTEGFSRSVALPSLDTKNYLILFLLWPFLACITAILNFGQKEARSIVYAFLVYYGLTFVVGNEGIDASRIAMTLKMNAMLPFSDIFRIIGGVYATDTTVDIVEPLISFVVSRITEDHRLLFGTFAALFGYFYVRSLNLLFEEAKNNFGWNSLIFIIFLASVLPVTSINGFRMWTAAWIFFYGAYHVILFKDARFLILTFSACLVHFSFLTANLVLLIYFFAGNRNLIYIPLVLLSFIVPNLIEPLIQSSFGAFGSAALQARVQMYTDTAYVQLRQESVMQDAWFLRIGSDMVLYYLLLAIVVVRYRMKNSVQNQPSENLFSFLLLFLAFVNFGMPIPSFGGRFMILFFMFATLYVFRFFVGNDSPRIDILTLVGLFPMLLFTAITFRQGSETMNAWLFAPGFGIPWLVPELTVFEVLFQ